MSRIGKKPVVLAKGVAITINGQNVSVKGPKGTVAREIHNTMNAVLENGVLTVVPKVAGKDSARFHGLTRTLISNMVVGVTEGFTKNLTLIGVGYKAAQNGRNLTLNVGYSHPVEIVAPAGIELKVDKIVNISVSGAEKEVVGQLAATIRGVRPPEPYHGKGIRYAEEVIVTKVGKAAGKK
jgi:large subunit ribosomal protein L6